MADLGMNFDATQVTPSEDQVAPGWHIGKITQSERRHNKNTRGEHMAIEFTLTQGKFQRWKLFEHLNLWNPNKQAEQIAQGKLSAIAHAVGVLQFNNLQALHDFEMQIRVAHDADGRAVIKGYKAIEHTEHQPSPGRAYAENNPTPQQPPQPTPQYPFIDENNQYNWQTGRPMNPQEVQYYNQQMQQNQGR